VDYDGDGDLDLVTGSDDCCDFDFEFFLFRRDADGRFQARESIRMGLPDKLTFSPRTKVCVADWDRDGHRDLIVQFNEERGVFVARGPLGDRPVIDESRRIGGSEPVRIAFTKPCVIDWDGDGVLDLLVGMREPNGDGVYLLRGLADSDETRLDVPDKLIAPPEGAKISGLDVADWDGDGVLDLIVGLTRWDGERNHRRLIASQVSVYRRIPSH